MSRLPFSRGPIVSPPPLPPVCNTPTVSVTRTFAILFRRNHFKGKDAEISYWFINCPFSRTEPNLPLNVYGCVQVDLGPEFSQMWGRRQRKSRLNCSRGLFIPRLGSEPCYWLVFLFESIQMMQSAAPVFYCFSSAERGGVSFTAPVVRTDSLAPQQILHILCIFQTTGLSMYLDYCRCRF